MNAMPRKSMQTIKRCGIVGQFYQVIEKGMITEFLKNLNWRI